MILTKDIRLQLDSQNDLYGNTTYKYYKGGSILTKRRYQTKTTPEQQILKTKTKYDLSKTQNFHKYSFLTEAEQTDLNLDKYLNTNHFYIITPDMKYRMRVVLKQVQRKDNRTADQRYLGFNPQAYKKKYDQTYKKQYSLNKETEKLDTYDYYILNAAECPEQNLTENYLNEYGEPCFEHFDYNVINKKQIYSTFVVCSFVGNNTFEVDCPYRLYRGGVRSNVKSLKEDSDVEKDNEKDKSEDKNNDKSEEDSGADEDSDSDDIENDRPLVLFKNQVEEVIHSFSDV